ncbi:myb-like protein X [Leptopilina heterotoma]|uniref:myb-like protein X n=1 Tax=Leptopilina heterotoma TaxID=63436 RepID=UPI001CAA17CD|nr:myb-like protein X [Leptopilina heterotoma]
MEVINCDSLKEETPTDLNNDLQKVERIKSLELLKKKMCRSHDLIQYYNDKKKECEQLTISLRKARAEANEMKNNYNTTLSKLIKQELQNTEQRKTIESYVTKIGDLETKIAGDQRFIEQLNCKIDSIENRSSGKLMDTELKFEEKVKTLELELKKLKKGPAKKNQGTNTDKVKVVEHGTNVRLDPKIPQVPTKKNIPSTSRKTTKSSTFLCEKCDIALNNLVQTFKVPEPMIQPFLPENKQYKFKSSESFAKLEDKKIESKVKNEVPVALENNIENQVKQEDSETLKILTKTLKTLERVIKSNKKSEKKAQCCHSNSGNQDLMFQMWKKLLDRDEPKKSQKKLKRCQNTRKSITKKKKEKKKKTKTKNTTNWSIESTINSEASTSQIDTFKIPQLIDHSKLLKRANSTIKKSNKRKKGNNETFSSSGENESLINSSNTTESEVNEIYLENKIEQPLNSIRKIGENDPETKMEIENSEKGEISLKEEEEEEEVQNYEEFPKIESLQQSESFGMFQSSVELENSQNNESSMENFKGFHNLQEGNLITKNGKLENSSLELKNGEELQKLEKTPKKSNLEEKMEYSKKENEKEKKVQILEENSTNLEEKIEKIEETVNENCKEQNEIQYSEEKSTNLKEEKIILDKELKNSAKSTNFEDETKGKNSSNSSNENLPEELLSAIDVLGEISFSDESILDCNASFLTLSTEKSQINPEESQIDENEEESKN